MSKYISMEANKQFKREHAEAERHNRGQFTDREVKRLLRQYKTAGYTFAEAKEQLIGYANQSRTTVPAPELLKLWW